MKFANSPFLSQPSDRSHGRRKHLGTFVRRSLSACLVVAAICATGPAVAHITLANPSASPGQYVKVVLQVPHGCSGGDTTGIRVRLPAELVVAKPMPKPGWKVSTENERLPSPVTLHGKEVNERTATIQWEGGRLPNAFFDEFVIYGKLSDQAQGKLAFKTLQRCDGAQTDWSGEAGSEAPAPTLLIVPAAPGSGHVH